MALTSAYLLNQRHIGTENDSCKTELKSLNSEKMLFTILLLINLISCVSGTFVVNVTQTSYQAEENHNITMEWTFTTKPDTSSNSLFIYCGLITEEKSSVLLYLHGGVEVPGSQDQHFLGRVQFDKDVLREGQIRLHLSRLRTEDSGVYLCKVGTDDGLSSGRCRLNVSAVVDFPQSQRPTVSPQPESQGRISIFAVFGLGLGLAAVVTAALLTVCNVNYFGRMQREKKST